MAGTDEAASAREALERQLLEIECLSAMFSPDEITTDAEAVLRAKAASSGDIPLDDEVGCLSVSVSLSLGDGDDRATLHATLPRAYPASAPVIEVSCTCLAPAAHAIVCAAVEAAAQEAAEADRESLADLCLAMQQAAIGAQQEQQHAQRSSQQQQQHKQTAADASASSARGTRIIWFHHIKSLEVRVWRVTLSAMKPFTLIFDVRQCDILCPMPNRFSSLQKRKEIVASARTLRLCGFCKPGFPGVIVCMGADTDCDAFVLSLIHI